MGVALRSHQDMALLGHDAHIGVLAFQFGGHVERWIGCLGQMGDAIDCLPWRIDCQVQVQQLRPRHGFADFERGEEEAGLGVCDCIHACILLQEEGVG